MIPDDNVPVDWHVQFDIDDGSPYDTLGSAARAQVRGELFYHIQHLRSPNGTVELPVAALEAGTTGLDVVVAAIQAQLDALVDPKAAPLEVGEPHDPCVYYEFVNGIPKCIRCFALLEGKEPFIRTAVADGAEVTAVYRVAVSWTVDDVDGAQSAA